MVNKILHSITKEEFEDTKAAIRIRKLKKDRQHKETIWKGKQLLLHKAMCKINKCSIFITKYVYI